MARGAAAPRATLRYDAERYVPGRVDEWEDKELRKEYTRLRDIAQKRIKRVSADPIASKTSDIYKEYRHGFPRLRDLPTKQARGRALADVARFVLSPLSTVGGARAAYVARVQRMGLNIEDIDPNSYMELGEWMEVVRLQFSDDYNSDLAYMYYKARDGFNVSVEDFNNWLNNYQAPSQWEVEPNSSSDDYDFSNI